FRFGHSHRLQHLPNLFFLFPQEGGKIPAISVFALPVVFLQLLLPFFRIHHQFQFFVPVLFDLVGHLLRTEYPPPNGEFGVDPFFLQRGHILQCPSDSFRGSDRQHPHFARFNVFHNRGGIGGDRIRISSQQRGHGFPASVIGHILQLFRIDSRLVSGQDGDQVVHRTGGGSARQRHLLRVLLQTIDQGTYVLVSGVFLNHDGYVILSQPSQRPRISKSVGTIPFFFQVIDQKGRGVDEQLVGLVFVGGRVFRPKNRPAAPGLVFHGDGLIHQLAFGQQLGQ